MSFMMNQSTPSTIRRSFPLAGMMVVLGLIFAAASPVSSANIQQTTALAAAGAEIGAFVDASPPTATAIKGFEHLSGRHIASVLWYQGWDASSQPPFPNAALNTQTRDHDGYHTHIILHLTWEPWVKLSQIANGNYDTYLTSYATQAKAWGEEIRLRFAHEMIQDNVFDNCNGQVGCPEWYPWQDQPANYIAAFRHVHDVFKNAGATNVKFVWCPNNYPFDLSIVQLYYPGQNYVDWLCMDGYNPTDKDGTPGYPDWYWFDDIFYPIYHTLIDHTDIFGNKPVMIGEFASCEAGPYEESGQTKPTWITNAFNRIKSPDYAQIKAFYWFNINKECDWRINSSSPSRTAFHNAMTSADFLSHPGRVFVSTGSEDGWVLESSENSNTGGSLDKTNAAIRLGDDAARKQYRSILSFKTDGLPDTATITSMTLKLRQSAIVGGGNPLTSFQGMLVEIRKGFFGASANLQLTDFQAAANKVLGPFTPVLTNKWYSIRINASAFPYVNKSLQYQGGITQFRLRFKLDDNNNTSSNYLSIASGNATSASRPQLIIEYTP